MDTASPPAAADFRQVMVGLGLAMLLSALDQTIVVTAMPTIGAELGDPQNLPSIVTAYLVASTIVTPLYGKLADVYGRRRVLTTALTAFIIGSIFCALAPTMGALALARFFQGLGGGGLIALAQTIIADLVSPLERGRFQAYFAAVFATSSIAGPVLGGLFAQYAHWSLIFWINLPLGLAALLITNARLKRLPERRHPHHIDYVLALGWGGNRYPWASTPILSLFGLSALFWAAFAWRTRVAEEPLIPLRIISLRVVHDATGSGALGLGSFVALSVVMPIYYEVGMGLSAHDSGLVLIPLMIATVAGATLSGRMMARLSHYKIVPLVGLGLGALAAAVASWQIYNLPFVALNALLLVSTFGVGAMLPVATVSVQNAVLARDLGTATATTQFFRQLGSSVIVALFGALALGGGRAAYISEARLSAEEMVRFAGSFRLVFAALAVCLALSFLFMARLEEQPLRSEKRR